MGNSRFKFRAWLIKEKKWFEDGFSVCESGYEIFDDDYNGWQVGKDVELMQFTGLLDQSGKEIYEGDIVRYSDDGDEGVCFVHYMGDSDYPAFDLHPHTWDWDMEVNMLSYFTSAADCSLEVIGNVYENPELREGGLP